jgi:hypothetical protein
VLGEAIYLRLRPGKILLLNVHKLVASMTRDL